MNTIALSIVIPIKVTFKNKFLLDRIKRLIQHFSNYQNTEIVIIDSSKNSAYSAAIKKSCQHFNVNYYHLKMDDVYSAAKARNCGSKNAKGEYLLFYDVDLVVKDDFIDNVLEDMEQLKAPKFTIYPCLYLSESKTKVLEGMNLTNKIFEDIKERYLRGFSDEVLYLAVNTSTILVERKHFFNIGAYSEAYKGHGYEDFELIHRLYMAYPVVERGLDYPEDFKTNFPSDYKGFRKYYAYYALPNFFRGMYTLHLWHPRPLTHGYYRQRKQNAKFFIAQLEESLKKPIPQDFIDRTMSIDFKVFIDDLYQKYKIDKNIYIGLERYNPNNVVKKEKSTWKRKLRKLFLNPKQFFLDMRLK
jgi:predicted glycosyltransferase involved in capsule biosynthesis